MNHPFRFVAAGLFLVLLNASVTPAFAQFEGGSGTVEDPYQIATVAQLQSVRDHVDAHFILTADIDATETAEWNGGAGFIPIGPDVFSGTLDGNHRNVIGLVINRPDEDGVGLIRKLGRTGQVVRLGLTDLMVQGRRQTGGIAGESIGTISQTFVEGEIIGGMESGGLTGGNYGQINESFVVGDIRGNTVGGIAGVNEGRIEDSFSRGRVVCEQGIAGGLLGYNGGYIVRSYSSVEGSCGPGSQGPIGGTDHYLPAVADVYWNHEAWSTWNRAEGDYTTREMLRISTYESLDFSETGVWSIVEGRTFPYHKWMGRASGYHFPAPMSLTAESIDGDVILAWKPPAADDHQGYNVYHNGILLTGGGPVSDTSIVHSLIGETAEHVYRVAAVYAVEGRTHESFSGRVNVLRTEHYEFAEGEGTVEDPWLIRTATDLSGIRFYPDGHFRIVNDINLDVAPWNEGGGWEPIPEFTGTLDGNGHFVDGLTINRPQAAVGLFRVVAQNASISKLGLRDVNIRGLMGAPFAATLYGSIDQVFTTGTVRCAYFASGLAGRGTLTIGKVSNSYSMSRVEGERLVGGLKAPGGGTIESSYFGGAARSIEDEPNMFNAQNPNSFWNGDHTTASASPARKTSEDLIISSTYSDWDFSDTGIWMIVEGESLPFHRWQGSVRPYNLPQPTNVSYDSRPDQIEIHWTRPPSAARVIGFNVYREEQRLNTDSPITSEFYVDDSVDEGDSDIEYTVTAVYDVDGSVMESASSASIRARTYVPFEDGDGTVDNPWQVATSAQFSQIRYNLSGHFILIADIDLSELQNNSDDYWDPPGVYIYSTGRLLDDAVECFSGTLDGNGYQISGLTIVNTENSPSGLFACIIGGSVQNLSLNDVDVHGTNFTGALTGLALAGSEVSDCAVTGIIRGADDTGGLVGRMDGESLIDMIRADVQVSGKVNVGGVVGNITWSAITNAVASGRVQGREQVGGVAGRFHAAPFRHNSFAGEVEGWSDGVGGLAGSMSSSTMFASYAEATVYGRSEVGGLVGVTSGASLYNSFSVATIYSTGVSSGGILGRNNGTRLHDTYALSTVHGTREVGGLVGSSHGEIARSYAVGKVFGDERVAGLVGYNHNIIRSSYWSVDESGIDVGVISSGDRDVEVSGVSNAQLRQSSTFEGWDFETTWAIREGQSFPTLRDIGASSSLVPPALVRPLDDFTASDSLVFEWNTVADARYLFQVALDPSFDTIVYSEYTYQTEWNRFVPDSGGRYYWRVGAESVRVNWSEVRTFLYSTSTSAYGVDLPLEFALGQSYPNPVRSSASIPYQLPAPAFVRIELYDIVGRRIATLIDGLQPAGYHSLTMDSRGVASGVYLLRMSVDGKAFVGKMIIID